MAFERVAGVKRILCMWEVIGHQVGWVQTTPDPTGTYTTGCIRCGARVRGVPQEADGEMMSHARIVASAWRIHEYNPRWDKLTTFRLGS